MELPSGTASQNYTSALSVSLIVRFRFPGRFPYLKPDIPVIRLSETGRFPHLKPYKIYSKFGIFR